MKISWNFPWNFPLKFSVSVSLFQLRLKLSKGSVPVSVKLTEIFRENKKSEIFPLVSPRTLWRILLKISSHGGTCYIISIIQLYHTWLSSTDTLWALSSMVNRSASSSFFAASFVCLSIYSCMKYHSGAKTRAHHMIIGVKDLQLVRTTIWITRRTFFRKNMKKSKKSTAQHFVIKKLMFPQKIQRPKWPHWQDLSI